MDYQSWCETHITLGILWAPVVWMDIGEPTHEKTEKNQNI